MSVEHWILAICNDYFYFEKAQKMALNYNIFIRHVEAMEEALTLLTKDDYILIVIRADRVDYMPGLRLIRELTHAPILIVSRTDDPGEKIEALRMGAEAYIAGSLGLDYVLESSLALIRFYKKLISKSPVKPITPLTYHYIFLCVETRKVFVKAKEVELSRIEFDILRYLMTKPGRVFTYEQIYRRVWKEKYADNFYDNLYNHISRLRQKIKTAPDVPEYIITVKEVGYKLETVFEQL